MKVAFYKATRPGYQGIFNRLVRWWTNGPYSHCEAVLNETVNGESLCASSSFIDGGIRLKKIVLDPAKWDFEEFPANPLIVAGWFGQRINEKYDSIWLFGFIWRRADGHKSRWGCSESVAAALGFSEAWRFDPSTLASVLRSYNTIAAGQLVIQK
jgi:hypothetical protein